MSGYDSGWSAWEWSNHWSCPQRYRLLHNGEYEYDYDQNYRDNYDAWWAAQSGITESYSLNQRTDTPRTDDHGTPQALFSAHSSLGPAMGSSYNADFSTTQDWSGTDYGPTLPSMYPAGGMRSKRLPPPTKIATKDSNAESEKVDGNFRIHHSSEFKFGKIFKIMWFEPQGSGGTEITVANAGPKSSKCFYKIRRFLIVKEDAGHCICVPILTYSGRGTTKNVARPNDHAVIYSSASPPPLLDGEALHRDPIFCKMKNEREKLDPRSRLNYAKLYTVEHNVKVCFIGRISSDCRRSVATNYNDVHPRLDSFFPPTPSSDDLLQLPDVANAEYTTESPHTGMEGNPPN